MGLSFLCKPLPLPALLSTSVVCISRNMHLPSGTYDIPSISLGACRLYFYSKIEIVYSINCSDYACQKSRQNSTNSIPSPYPSISNESPTALALHFFPNILQILKPSCPDLFTSSHFLETSSPSTSVYSCPNGVAPITISHLP